MKVYCGLGRVWDSGFGERLLFAKRRYLGGRLMGDSAERERFWQERGRVTGKTGRGA